MVLRERPSGRVRDADVVLAEGPEPEPGPSAAVVRVRYLSIDPTIRTWMNDAPGYMPPIGLGDTVRGAGLGEVVRSNSARYAPGDLVIGMTGWQDYTIADEGLAIMQVVPSGIDPVVALSVLGVTGMTAFFGMIEVGKVAEGDTVVVSAAAGATGSVAGQIARIRGAARVIGIAGSPEKCSWIVDSLGFDGAINYRAEDVAAALRAQCPEGIDLYYDNVGGTILEACIGQLALHARIVLCGAISMYEATTPPAGPANVANLILKRARMEGFLLLDYFDRFPEAQAALATWLAEGRISHNEHVIDGLERSPEALNMLFTGGNTGKMIVRL